MVIPASLERLLFLLCLFYILFFGTLYARLYTKHGVCGHRIGNATGALLYMHRRTLGLAFASRLGLMESKVGYGAKANGRYQCCCCLYVDYDVPIVDRNRITELYVWCCGVQVPMCRLHA